MKRIIEVCLLFVLVFFGCTQAKNRGSKNLGNSCYFNATLQALSHAEALNILLRTHQGDYKKNAEIALNGTYLYDYQDTFPARYLDVVDELKKIAVPQAEALLPAIEPRFLYTMTMSEVFRRPGVFNQEDAHELIMFLLESVISEVACAHDLKAAIYRQFSISLLAVLGIDSLGKITNEKQRNAYNALISRFRTWLRRIDFSIKVYTVQDFVGAFRSYLQALRDDHQKICDTKKLHLKIL